MEPWFKTGTFYPSNDMAFLTTFSCPRPACLEAPNVCLLQEAFLDCPQSWAIRLYVQDLHTHKACVIFLPGLVPRPTLLFPLIQVSSLPSFRYLPRCLLSKTSPDDFISLCSLQFHQIPHLLLSLCRVYPTSLYFCCCCCSVAKFCLTLCDPMDCSLPGFTVLHCLQVCSNSYPLSQ